MVIFECGRIYSIYLRLSAATWEGARYFSSLKDPVEACLGYATTNLAFTEPDYREALSGPEKAAFDSHHKVHSRVANIFYFDPQSWPLESDSIIPCADEDGDCPELKFEFPNLPSISTQYIDSWDGDEGCTPYAADESIDFSDLNKMVTVCLKALYLGVFVDIPLNVCSSGYQLNSF